MSNNSAYRNIEVIYSEIQYFQEDFGRLEY